MKVLARRAVAIAAVTVLSLGVAACGDDGDGDGTNSSGGSAGSGETSAAMEEAQAEVDEYLSNPPLELEPLSATPEPGLKVASVTCTYGSCYPGEFAKAAEELGWEASEETYDLGKGPSAFVSAVRRALQTEPDALAILFVFPVDVIADEIAQAQEQGVKLIDVASALDAPPEGFIGCIYCMPTLEAYGTLLGKYAAVDAGAPTGFGVVGDNTTDANRISGQASMAEIERLLPDAEVEEINLSFARTPQANAQTVVAALQRNPNIEYLVFQSPDIFGGMAQALSAAGLDDKVKVLNTGPSSGDMVMEVQTGIPYAWVADAGPSYWWDVVDLIARSEVGDDFNPVPVVALRLINSENAEPDMYAPPNYQDAFKQAWGVGS